MTKKINPDLERLIQKIVTAKDNREKSLLLAILKRKYPDAKVPK